MSEKYKSVLFNSAPQYSIKQKVCRVEDSPELIRKKIEREAQLQQRMQAIAHSYYWRRRPLRDVEDSQKDTSVQSV